jgi:hypothetical protein
MLLIHDQQMLTTDSGRDTDTAAATFLKRF